MEGMAAAVIADRRPDLFLEVFDQALIDGIMDMAVEHVSLGTAVFHQLVLTVIAEDRIMAEDDFTVVVTQLCIGPDPFEAGSAVAFFGPVPVMVALDQAEMTVELLQKRSTLLCGSERQIPKNNDFIIPSDFLIPFLNHIGVHFRHIGKPSAVHLMIDVGVIEMTVGDIVSHNVPVLFDRSAPAAGSFHTADARIYV